MAIPSFAAKKLFQVSKASLKDCSPDPLGSQEGETDVKVKDENTDLTPKCEPMMEDTPAYHMFAKLERSKIKTDLGNLSDGEVMKEIARRWSNLDEEDKFNFHLESMKTKEKLVKKKEAKESKKVSSSNVSKEVVKESKPENKKNNKRAVKLENEPSPTTETDEVTKYFAFLFSNWVQMCQSNPDSSPKDIQDMLWKHWKITNKQTLNHSSRKPNLTKGVSDPSVTKTANSAFLLFANSHRAEVTKRKPSLSHKEVMEVLAKLWNEMDEKSKAPFLEHNQQLKADKMEMVSEVAGREM